MTYEEARKVYADQLYAHGWCFLSNRNRATRWRDDQLTDARDQLETMRDKERP